MTDTEEDSEPSKRPGVDFVVPPDALLAIQIDKLLADLQSLDCFDINQHLMAIAKDMDPAEAAAINLLAGLTNYHVDPDHRTEPFKPMFIMGNRRSLVPSDLMPEQIGKLADFAPHINNCGLKGRIADVVWFMQRSRQDMAEIAVGAYCDSVEMVRDGQATFGFNDESAWGVHAKELLVRAGRISLATKWQLNTSNRYRELVADLVLTAFNEERADDFIRIADVDIDHDITGTKSIAAMAETLAGGGPVKDNPETRISLWSTATRCFRRIRDDAEYERCAEKIADCQVEKANLAGSAMLQASFLRDAIQTLRNLSGTRSKRDQLSERLRQSQAGIQDEMTSFSHEIDLSELVTRSIDSVQGVTWPKAFLSLILCDVPPKPETVREQAQKHAEEFVLQGIMPMQVHDFQGRLVFKAPGISDHTEESEEHFRYLMAVQRSHYRKITVSGVIEPIRNAIASEHMVSSQVIAGMLKDSPFVPPDHVMLFANAIVAFLGGDDIEAASLLIPQLENSLRHILEIHGTDTTTADADGIQTEASLSQLLSPGNPWREKLEAALPSRYTHEIDLLFTFAGGPALRNQIAHGKVPAGGFWTEDMIYGTWLIIHLAALPLAGRWGDVEETFARVTGQRKVEDTDGTNEEASPNPASASAAQ